MTTINTIIKDAFFDARITDLVDGPTAEQSNYALRVLNRIVDDLSTEDILMPYRTSENFAISSSSVSYTMGSGGTASSSRAKKIIDCFIRDSSDYDTPVKIIPEVSYNAISDKSVSARPSELYYDPVYPVGVIYFNYLPDNDYTAYIESLKDLHSDLTRATTLSLPAEYERLLEKALAVDLAVTFNTPNASALAAQYERTRSKILALNLSQRVHQITNMPFSQEITKKGELFNVD